MIIFRVFPAALDHPVGGVWLRRIRGGGLIGCHDIIANCTSPANQGVRRQRQKHCNQAALMCRQTNTQRPNQEVGVGEATAIKPSLLSSSRQERHVSPRRGYKFTFAIFENYEEAYYLFFGFCGWEFPVC